LCLVELQSKIAAKKHNKVMLSRDSFAIDTKKLSLLKSQNKTTPTTSSKLKDEENRHN
jgi:hypothetical protein